MANFLRKLKRRKQREGNEMATENAPQVEENRFEEKLFSEAELEAFTQKHNRYQEAVRDVNEFLDFLRKQHGVSADEGWQLGPKGFFRPVKSREGED